MSRTPSAEAHTKVLAAALRLIGERGIDATSMDAIAAESGVSKATLYKHWTNKDALLFEVIENLSEKLPDFDSGDAKTDLRNLLRHLAQSRKRDELGRIWPRVIGYAAGNRDFAKGLRNFVPRKRAIARILERAIEAGELKEQIDPDLAMDLLIGPVMHRRFVSLDAIPAKLPEQVVNCFWQVFATNRPR